MTPDMTNFSGNVHGGAILNLLDKVAYACASRYSGHYVVTLSVDQVFFKEPVRVGDLVTFLASVNAVGTSSMEVGIRVEAEDIRAGTRRHTNSCYFTMIAVDASQRPVAVSPLEPVDPVAQRRQQEAARRRVLRKAAYGPPSVGG
jgi:acyl-CoA hydrolase